jgi:hypothetical protein
MKYSLMDYITGHLNDSELNQVRLHVDQCSECRNQLEAFLTIQKALQQSSQTRPGSAYYSSILPRVQERLANQRTSYRNERWVTSAILLPLAVSVLFVTLLIRMPSESLSGHRNMHTLSEAVKEFTADEVYQAVTNEYSGSPVSPNQEVVFEGIEEHLQGDHFIREAITQQLFAEEIGTMGIDGIFSGVNREQTDIMVSELIEREM